MSGVRPAWTRRTWSRWGSARSARACSQSTRGSGARCGSKPLDEWAAGHIWRHAAQLFTVPPCQLYAVNKVSGRRNRAFFSCLRKGCARAGRGAGRVRRGAPEAGRGGAKRRAAALGAAQRRKAPPHRRLSGGRPTKRVFSAFSFAPKGLLHLPIIENQKMLTRQKCAGIRPVLYGQDNLLG